MPTPLLFAFEKIEDENEFSNRVEILFKSGLFQSIITAGIAMNDIKLLHQFKEIFNRAVQYSSITSILRELPDEEDLINWGHLLIQAGQNLIPDQEKSRENLVQIGYL